MSEMQAGDEGRTSRRWLTACALVVLTWLLASWLNGRVTDQPRYQVGLAQVAILAQRSSGQVFAVEAHELGPGPVLLDAPMSISNPELIPQLKRRLTARPFVQRVLGVERQFPRDLSMRVQLREPLAVVHAGIERLMVDREGVVLVSHPSLRAPELPVIRTPGAPLTSVPYEGMAFRQAAVIEAVTTLADIAVLAKAGHRALDHIEIKSLQVGYEGTPRNDGGSDLTLLCADGLQILWGRSPISAMSQVEASSEAKLDRLWRILSKYKHSLIGVRRIEVCWERPEVVPK